MSFLISFSLPEFLSRAQSSCFVLIMAMRALHPQTLFHLVPESSVADVVLKHPDNEPFVSYALTKKPQLGLEIGYHVPGRPRPEVIAEVGRNADLILPSTSISAIHFSFEVHPESKAILLCDRSRHHSTKVEPVDFRHDGTFRQIVLQPDIEYKISVGGPKKDHYAFTLHWTGPKKALQLIEKGYHQMEQKARNPRLVRTTEEGIDDLPSWYNTRLHTPAHGGVQRVLEGQHLGRGAWGEVKKAIDIDSGSFVAVKKIFLPPKDQRTFEKECLIQREVKVLSRISHVSLK